MDKLMLTLTSNSERQTNEEKKTAQNFGSCIQILCLKWHSLPSII